MKEKIILYILTTIAFLVCLGVDFYILIIEPVNESEGILGELFGLGAFWVYVQAIMWIMTGKKDRKES